MCGLCEWQLYNIPSWIIPDDLCTVCFNGSFPKLNHSSHVCRQDLQLFDKVCLHRVFNIRWHDAPPCWSLLISEDIVIIRWNNQQPRFQSHQILLIKVTFIGFQPVESQLLSCWLSDCANDYCSYLDEWSWKWTWEIFDFFFSSECQCFKLDVRQTTLIFELPYCLLVLCSCILML